MIEDVNDEIPLFTEREQERVLEGEPIGTVVTRVNAIDRDGTFPNNQVYYYIKPNSDGERFFKIIQLCVSLGDGTGETNMVGEYS